MVDIVCYLFLCKDELGVGEVVARWIPRAAASLRLWGAFRMLSRYWHRQALGRGKGSKDVSFLILFIVRFGPYFRLLLPTSGKQGNHVKYTQTISRLCAQRPALTPKTSYLSLRRVYRTYNVVTRGFLGRGVSIPHDQPIQWCVLNHHPFSQDLPFVHFHHSQVDFCPVRHRGGYREELRGMFVKGPNLKLVDP
jgi:hypothetical protein